jgi:hypothetical protein
MLLLLFHHLEHLLSFFYSYALFFPNIHYPDTHTHTYTLHTLYYLGSSQMITISYSLAVIANSGQGFKSLSN